MPRIYTRPKEWTIHTPCVLFWRPLFVIMPSLLTHRSCRAMRFVCLCVWQAARYMRVFYVPNRISNSHTPRRECETTRRWSLNTQKGLIDSISSIHSHIHGAYPSNQQQTRHLACVFRTLCAIPISIYCRQVRRHASAHHTHAVFDCESG